MIKMNLALKSLALTILMCSFVFTNVHSQDKYELYIGTYTAGSSKGIYKKNYTNALQTAEFVWSATNPSYFEFSPDENFLYYIEETHNSEGTGGKITALQLIRGTYFTIYKVLNTKSTEGNDPCYVAVHPSGKWVATGNYSSGSITIFKVNADGSLGTSTTIKHEGKSINAERQEASHIHATVFSPDGKYLYAPDLGTDKVMNYKFDETTGTLIANRDQPFVASVPGSGPRHFIFHPTLPLAYLIHELTGEVAVYGFTAGTGILEKVQAISTVPTGFKGYPGSADIHISPDGKFLYASNRGTANNIAIFKIKKTSGTLTYIGAQPVLGKTPRNFSIHPSGKWLLVANQDTNEIVIFSRNKRTGLLSYTDRSIKIGSPVCLKWLKRK